MLRVWGTYKTLDPGPYCPETGQAHTTFNAFSVAFVVPGAKGGLVPVWLARRSRSGVAGSTGITTYCSLGKQVLE